MKTYKNIARQTRRKGFSLVEIVIAIGILSFCVVGMFGLIGVGMTSDRRATEDTVLGAMALQVVSDQRRALHNNTAPQVPKNYYFDQEGNYSPSSPDGSSSDANTIYRCVMTAEAAPAGAVATGLGNYLQVYRLTFTWPYGAQGGYTKYIHVTLPSQFSS